MKLIKASLLVICWILSTSIYAQSGILKKEWIVKRVSVDTLLLSPRSTENIQNYIEKPCEFQDTTYYWLFNKSIIEINQVIRSCTKQLSQSTIDSTSVFKKQVLTKFESADLNPQETRLSLWTPRVGKFELKSTSIRIMDTEKFDGYYRMKFLDSKKIWLILIHDK